MKQGLIENSVQRSRAAIVRTSSTHKTKNSINLEFEPLVQVDPSVMSSNREPLQNPRVGDYLLKQTASTEGIASKKSLELKKRYLLGDSALSSGIMKSDSMTMLDSKFKNFRSTINDCQKLLNPLANESNAIAPASIDFDNKMTTNSIQNKAEECQSQRNEEKENVYDQIICKRNELNKTESMPDVPKATNKLTSENGEKQPTILAENKIRVTSVKLIESNANETPVKKITANCEVIENKSEQKQNSFEFSDKFKPSDADDEPKSSKDQNVDSNKVNEYTPVYEIRNEHEHFFGGSKISPDKLKSSTDLSQPKGVNENIEPMLSMPCIVWAQSNQKRPDSDTFSSSTSSPAEIPHFILDSTTSPDTLATPSENIGNKGDDLMQMDSLMLIDGKYIGDPEDLKHIKMPDSFTKVSLTAVTATPTVTNKTIIHVPPSVECVVPETMKEIQMKQQPIKMEQKFYKYEPIFKRFDTKNENKVDTLKSLSRHENIPLNLPSESEKIQKPNQLNLAVTNTLDVIESPDNDKTPTVSNPGNLFDHSDSETEITGQALTETELSDWVSKYKYNKKYYCIFN